MRADRDPAPGRQHALKPGDYSIVPASLDYPWFAGTGFDAASVLTGLVGVETDTIPNNMTAENSCGNQLTVFFHRELGGISSATQT